MRIIDNDTLDGEDDDGVGPSGCGDWCAALHKVERAIAGHPAAVHFDANDFSWYPLHRPRRPTMHHYKHALTRRYLILDADGHAYKWFPPRDPASRAIGRFVRHRSLIDAIDALHLWETTRMRRKLVGDRLDMSWDE
jgi:hypothetical protein